MNAFVTHPSVRIKGTENNYDPVQCLDPSCPNKTPHMHCPFCVKTESFQDPVILRAHYRVKHVDKGIEFAGLTVLRCCDHCDIVGTIKGVKEFKGAHWHCYKCKNGFNRRDEAVKHYRTHFRNPQTTFQIQISQLPIQEVMQQYQMNVSHQETDGSAALVSDDLTTIHPALTEAVMTTSNMETGLTTTTPATYSRLSNGRSEEDVHVSVAANETVGPVEQHTIMIIQEDQLDGSQFPLPNNTGALEIMPTEIDKAAFEKEVVMKGVRLVDDRSHLEQQLVHMAQQNQLLENEKKAMEEKLNGEISQLKEQISRQKEELSEYQRREAELVTQLTIPLDASLQEVLEQMKMAHTELLHQQLANLKREYLQQQLPSTLKYQPLIMVDGTSLSSSTSAEGDHTESLTPTTSAPSTPIQTSHALSVVQSQSNEAISITNSEEHLTVVTESGEHIPITTSENGESLMLTSATDSGDTLTITSVHPNIVQITNDTEAVEESQSSEVPDADTHSFNLTVSSSEPEGAPIITSITTDSSAMLTDQSLVTQAQQDVLTQNSPPTKRKKLDLQNV